LEDNEDNTNNYWKGNESRGRWKKLVADDLDLLGLATLMVRVGAADDPYEILFCHLTVERSET
jgi:hypothetical protein